MVTQTLERPIEFEDSVVLYDEDPEVVHVVCHCSNDNIAMCGTDVSDSDLSPEGPSDEDCLLCLLTLQLGRCPWGCSCEECVA